MSFRNLMSGAAIVALASVCAIEAQAQETSGDIRGQVTTEAGAPVAGASVTVIHVPSNTIAQAQTDAAGSFSARGLRVGGPYNVIVQAAGYPPQQLEGVSVNLGSTTRVSLALQSGQTETIVVTASPTTMNSLATGPAASFSLSDIEVSPTINRDLKDIIRQDPRIFLDTSNEDGVQCAGASPRFNSLTVDGIGLNDGFGLNNNGYPTERMPFPFDAIEGVSVELAPFDVNYGAFTACNINAVTKSGTNELHGSAFYDYTDDSLQGDSLSGVTFDRPEFDEKRYGFTIGGPILQDRLFFFGAYEKFEGFNIFDRGPEGSGAANEVIGFTVDEYNRILDIAQNVYEYDPGGTPGAEPSEDEKYLARIDWNITNSHRASVTYNYNTGLNLTESDEDDNEFEYFNHLYSRGAELNAYSGQLFSDWTDNFSTEFRFAVNEVDFTQRSVNGTDVGEIQIADSGNIIYLGADDSRHSNDLNYTTKNYRGVANYQWNEHSLTFGAERLEYEIFNLFAQHTEGEWRFSSIDDFESGDLNRVFYGNAVTNNPADTSKEFSYATNTLLLQDEFVVNGNVTITAGLRYDYYESDDEPRLNQNFVDRYGFANTETFDGEGLLQPRFGLTYDASDDLTLRAGVGLYSGGNPNVWLSNSFSNDGISNIQLEYRPSRGQIGNLLDGSETFVEDEGGLGRPLWGVPESMYDAIASGTADSTVNAVDPDFEIPAEWKYSLGFTLDFDLPGPWGQGYRLNGDWLYSDSKAASTVIDLAAELAGTAPDGRPIYDNTRPDNFSNDFLLTNGAGGSQTVFSVSLEKSYDDLGIDWSAAYAFVDASNAASMISAVAFSNFTGTATSDPNNLEVSTSNYEIPHRFTGRVSWERAFFRDLMTRATLFGYAYQGRPSSFTFGVDAGDLFGDPNDFRHLLYVPTGPDDPLVEFGPDFDTAAFFAYVDGAGLVRGEIAGRNEYEGQWTNQFDLKLEQEFPGVMADHVSSAFLTVENIGNLINDEWGQIHEASFFQTTSIVDADYVRDGMGDVIVDSLGNPTTYLYEEFLGGNPESLVTEPSFWSITVGLRYEF